MEIYDYKNSKCFKKKKNSKCFTKSQMFYKILNALQNFKCFTKFLKF